MDHPADPNHPTVFMCGDGWMGASLTFDGPRDRATKGSLRLRYGLYVHGGARGWKSWKNGGSSLRR